ncbi:MAG: HEPN domain-containing protein [Lentisphaeria bacterium]|nr:HEPN domain-containing protein [Lentisphaeria bacterium]
MTEAAEAFNRSIQDAQELLDRFDDENTPTSNRNPETLKRAGLVIAMAAWETYIKDRIREEFEVLLKAVGGSPLGRFVQKRLAEDLKRFFNPNSLKVKQLFENYFEVDVTEQWVWDNYDAHLARETLNKLISKRGDAAHQAKTSPKPDNEPHLVKRDDLEKAIRFLKGLVMATDKVKIVK